MYYYPFYSSNLAVECTSLVTLQKIKGSGFVWSLNLLREESISPSLEIVFCYSLTVLLIVESVCRYLDVENENESFEIFMAWRKVFYHIAAQFIHFDLTFFYINFTTSHHANINGLSN